MPGVLNGAIILKRISILEAPSQYAASSSSTGIFSKYAFNSHIEVGIQNAIPGTIIAKYVFKRPKYLNRLNRGINNTAPENTSAFHGYYNANNDSTISTAYVSPFLDSPSVAAGGNLQYKIQIYLQVSMTFYLNRTVTEYNQVYGDYLPSFLTVMEIAA